METQINSPECCTFKRYDHNLFDIKYPNLTLESFKI